MRSVPAQAEELPGVNDLVARSWWSAVPAGALCRRLRGQAPKLLVRVFLR